MNDDLPFLQTALAPLAGIATLGDPRPKDQRGEPGASVMVAFADGQQVQVCLNAETVFLDAPAGSAALTVTEVLAVLQANTLVPFKTRLEPNEAPRQPPVFALEGRFVRAGGYDLAVLAWQAWLAVHHQRHLFSDLWRNA